MRCDTDDDVRLIELEARRLRAESLIHQLNTSPVRKRELPVRLLEWHDLNAHMRQHWLALAYLNLLGEEPDLAAQLDAPFTFRDDATREDAVSAPSTPRSASSGTRA